MSDEKTTAGYGLRLIEKTRNSWISHAVGVMHAPSKNYGAR